MDVLSQMIMQMDRHAVRSFKIFAGRTSEDADRKDIRYFDYIRQHGAEAEEDKIFRRLYKGEDKNAFYRLKNRLASDLNISLFIQEYERNDIMNCLYHTAMGYYYAGKNNFRIALHFFKKAENRAIEIEQYGILDIIYSQMIKLAREIVAINPEVYIRKRQENRAMLNRLSEMEDILEVVEYRMKISQNLAQVQIPELLERTLDEYSKDEELKNSAKMQFSIYFIISRVLLQNKDYPSLEEYLVRTYNDFLARNFFSKSNHQHKLQMLAWIANAAFMNKRYSLSLQYAEKLREEMERYDRLHYDAFEFFYYNVQVINFGFINPSKVIELLQKLVKENFVEKNPYYGVFVWYNLSSWHFVLKEYSKSIVSLNKLYRHPGYENLDMRMKLHIRMGELMIRYDAREYELLEYALRQIHKDFRELLEQDELEKERGFLLLLARLAGMDAASDKAGFRGEVRAYREQFHDEWGKEETLFRYEDWLAEKSR